MQAIFNYLPTTPTLVQLWNNPRLSWQRFDLWCRKEPKVFLITSLALATLGTLLLPASLTAGATVIFAAGCIAAKVAWCHRYLAYHVAYEILGIPYTPSLNCSSFTEQTEISNHAGQPLATLTYRNVADQQSIPVLHMDDNTSPYEQGEAQGYAMAEQLWDLVFQVMPLMMQEAGKDRSDPSLQRLKTQAENLYFPPAVLEEIEGIADGFIRWGNGRQYSFDKAELLVSLRQAHVLTDTYKAIGSGHSLPGCSTVVMRDSDQQLIVGRLLDWISIGKIGQLLFVKSYAHSSEEGSTRRIYSHTFPGFVGGLTCWNDDGLKIIVNELGVTSRTSGIPYNLAVKQLIEQCSTVEQVKGRLMAWQNTADHKIASSVSLTVVDTHHASLFQLYPHGDVTMDNGAILAEESSQEPKVAALTCLAPGLFERPYRPGDASLLTTNHAYFIDSDNNTSSTIPNSLCDGTSEERLCSMRQATGSVETLLQSAGEKATIGAYVFDSSGHMKIVADNYNAFKLLPQATFFHTDMLH